jgi:hypothetical protein
MRLTPGPTDEYKTLNELVELSGIGMREVRGRQGGARRALFSLCCMKHC